MILQYTHQWVTEPSPHTGQLKTVTRRLAGPLDYAIIAGAVRYVSPLNADHQLTPDLPVDVIYAEAGYVRWRRGNPYAVQPGRGMRAIARICIEDMRLQRANDITDSDAILEGFKDAAHFRREWAGIHGDRFANAYVWRLAFSILPIQAILL